MVDMTLRDASVGIYVAEAWRRRRRRRRARAKAKKKREEECERSFDRWRLQIYTKLAHLVSLELWTASCASDWYPISPSFIWFLIFILGLFIKHAECALCCAWIWCCQAWYFSGMHPNGLCFESCSWGKWSGLWFWSVVWVSARWCDYTLQFGGAFGWIQSCRRLPTHWVATNWPCLSSFAWWVTF